jgi:hypothetical protein
MPPKRKEVPPVEDDFEEEEPRPKRTKAVESKKEVKPAKPAKPAKAGLSGRSAPNVEADDDGDEDDGPADVNDLLSSSETPRIRNSTLVFLRDLSNNNSSEWMKQPANAVRNDFDSAQHPAKPEEDKELTRS